VGGTGTFHDGLPNGVRVDLLFSSGDTQDAVLSTIDTNMPLPGGFTWTSAGLNLVRTRLFNTATGMRSSAAAVPCVLIVLTDGQASCSNTNICFEPTAAARALRDDGVTVLAVGVGSAVSQSQLVSIAGTSQNVFQVTQYSQLPDISNRVDGQSCSACVSLPFELPSTIQIGLNEYRCVRVCGASQSVLVTVDAGVVDAYISTSQFGGPRNNTASALDIQANSQRSLAFPDLSSFLVLRGRAAGSRVVVRFVASSTVTTLAAVSASLNDTEPTGTVISELGELAVTSAEPHSFFITSGNTDYFGISTDGAVTVSSALAPAAGTVVTLEARGIPRSALQCSTQATGGGGATVVDVTVTLTVLSTAAASSSSSDNSSGSAAGIVIGVLIMLALLAAAMVLLARRNNYRCGTSGPSAVLKAPNPTFALAPVGSRNAVFNDTYSAVNPPPPPRPAPPRPAAPPNASHGGAITNDNYMPTIPKRGPVGTTYVEPAGSSSVDTPHYSSADLPDSHYATALDVASAVGGANGVGASAAFGTGAGGWGSTGDQGALVNDVYAPAVPNRAPAYAVPSSLAPDNNLYATASVPELADPDAAAEGVGAGAVSFGTGTAASGVSLADQGAIVNETYLSQDAPPPRAPPVPKQRPSAAPKPTPRPSRGGTDGISI